MLLLEYCATVRVVRKMDRFVFFIKLQVTAAILCDEAGDFYSFLRGLSGGVGATSGVETLRDVIE